MSKFDTIAAAAAYSRAHGQIATSYAVSADDALEALIDCVEDGEDYDYVDSAITRGDGSEEGLLDFWAFPDDQADLELGLGMMPGMSMRVRVIIG